jgi:cobalt-zinc-cadmium efflux system outer membrane protein
MSTPISRVHAQADTGARTALLNALKRFSPELTGRRATLRAAEARLRATGVVAPLTLSGELEEVSRGADIAGAGSARIEVSREFVPNGLQSARRAVAQADVEQERVSLDVAERTLIIRTDLLLIRAAGSLLIARRLAAEDSLLSRAEESIRTRFAVGDARYVDVLRLRTERLRVQTERAAAITNARVNQRALAALVPDSNGLPNTSVVDSVLTYLLNPASALSVGAMLWSQLPLTPGIDSLLSLSGAVRLATIDIERTEAARRVALAERRPLLSTSLGVQRFEKADRGHTVGPTLAFSVSLPFTARSSSATAIAAAEDELTAARARARAAIAASRIDLAAARDRYEAVRERLALYDAALLRGAREERETALAAYRSGELSLIELLDFERALSRAEIAQIQGRIDAADALAELLGGASGGLEAGSVPNDHSALRPESGR